MAELSNPRVWLVQAGVGPPKREDGVVLPPLLQAVLVWPLVKLLFWRPEIVRALICWTFSYTVPYDIPR